MEEKSKRIVKNTIMLYIRMGVMIIIQLYASRLVLERLGVEDFGIYNLVGGVVIIMQFLNNSLTLSVNRFITYSLSLNKMEETRKTFSMSLNIHLLLALSIFLITETLGLWFLNTQLVIPASRMFAANVVYQFSILSFLIMIVRVPYNATIIAHEKMDIYAYLSIFEGIGKLLAVLALPYLLYDHLIVYSGLLFVVTIFSYLGYFIYCRMHYKESKYLFFWSKQLFKEIATFAGFSTFGNLATSFVNQGQDFILNHFFGPTLNAVRAISVQVNTAVCSFITSIYTASSPQITKSYAQQDHQYLQLLIYNVTKLSNYILLLLVIPLTLEMEYILHLWLIQVPNHTVVFCQLILLNSLIFYFATPSIIAIQATGNVKRIHLWTGSINLCNLLFAFLAFYLFEMPPYTIFTVQLIISSFMLIATLIIQKVELKIAISTYLYKVGFPVLKVILIAPILPFLVHKELEVGFLRLVIVTLVALSTILLSAYFMGIDQTLRKNINKKIHHKIKRR